MAVERLAGQMGQWLADQFNWSTDEQEIATFSLLLMISAGFTLILLVLFGWLAGVLAEILVMAGTAAILRTFAGGAHLSSGWRCSWVTAAAATAGALVARWAGPLAARWLGEGVPWVLLGVGLAVAALMARRAPVPAPEKPLRSPRHRQILRALAVGTSLLWAVAAAVWAGRGGLPPSLWLASTFGLLQEAFSVTPSGGRTARWLDHMLFQSFTKGGERV